MITERFRVESMIVGDWRSHFTLFANWSEACRAGAELLRTEKIAFDCVIIDRQTFTKATDPEEIEFGIWQTFKRYKLSLHFDGKVKVFYLTSVDYVDDLGGIR